MVEEGARLELLEMRIHENWHFTKLMMCFCRWKKRCKIWRILGEGCHFKCGGVNHMNWSWHKWLFQWRWCKLVCFWNGSKITRGGYTFHCEFKGDAKIGRAIFPISLENDLTIKERSDIQGLFHNYHHLFTTNYKDVKKVILEEHKIEFLLNAKPLRQRFEKMNPNYAQTIKEVLNKLLETQLIVLVENLKWVSPITIKKKRKLCVCVNY
jgi:hypothetical protein